MENGKHADRAKQPAPEESWRSSELCGIILQRQAFFRSRLSKTDTEERERDGAGKGGGGDDPDMAAIVKIIFTTTFQLA